jgi:hypothetical protein
MAVVVGAIGGKRKERAAIFMGNSKLVSFN